MAKEVQPSGDWEASYESIQHYRRIIEAADIAIQNLIKMDVPPEARDIHSTTIDVLGNVGVQELCDEFFTVSYIIYDPLS